MSGSGGGGNTNTIQQTGAPAYAQPYLVGGSNLPDNGGFSPVTGGGVLPTATNLFAAGGPQYFPGQTYAPENAAQAGGLSGTEALGLGGSPITGAATSSAENILNPSFLQSNPGNAAYNDILGGGANVKSAIAQAMPGLMDTFTQGNRLNSPGAANAVGSGIGTAVGNLELQAGQGLSQNYASAAGQQNTAGLIAPQTQGMAYTDLANATNAGTTQQGLSQNVINDALSRYNYNQTLPFNMVDWYNSIVTGAPGSTSTLSTPYFKPQTGGATGALGGAVGGAALGSSFGPYGTAIGAVAGGLLGGFS